MLKKLSILGTVALLSACQTTGQAVSESPRVSSNNVENSVYMKDTRPRGLGSREWGTWNQDMPTSPWVYNLTNIVPARNGELSQRFELRNGDCTTNQPPGDSHPNDWAVIMTVSVQKLCIRNGDQVRISGLVLVFV